MCPRLIIYNRIDTDGARAHAVCIKFIVKDVPGADMKESAGREKVSVNPPQWWRAALKQEQQQTYTIPQETDNFVVSFMTFDAPARAVCVKSLVNNGPGAHMKEPTGREKVSVNPPYWRGAALTSRTSRNAHHFKKLCTSYGMLCVSCCSCFRAAPRQYGGLALTFPLPVGSLMCAPGVLFTIHLTQTARARTPSVSHVL